MTIKDLERIILSSQQQRQQDSANKEMQQLLQRLRDKPFWIWNKTDEHEKRKLNTKGDCCFNHIIGLPQKNGKEYPIFNYEQMVIRALMENSYLSQRAPTEEERTLFNQKLIEAEQMTKDKHKNVKTAHQQVLAEKTETLVDTKKNKHVSVLKAAGLGISELALRWIAWLCLRNDDLKKSQVVIFTGPRLELAVSLMNRLKDLFRPHNITFTDKETVLNLNGVRIECFPSHHADSARGLPNISIIFADEFSFFPDHEIDNIMDIIIRNVPKSNPYLLAVSTPQKPNDAMDRLLKEAVETSPFKKVLLDWTYGVGKIYTQQEIDKIKNSRSFEREYCLKFKGLIGNVFSTQSIENCQKIEYNPLSVIPNCKVSIGIDPSFGSSKVGIVATRFVNERIEVIVAEEHERPEYNAMLDRIWEIKQQHKVDDNNHLRGCC
jgi:hypothetical protein